MERVSIRKIKDEVPIELLITSLGGRLRSSSSWTEWIPTHCPFHEDNVASSGVNRSSGRFVCHGCDVAGDVIDLACHITGGGIPEAIDWLVKEFHVR